MDMESGHVPENWRHLFSRKHFCALCCVYT